MMKATETLMVLKICQLACHWAAHRFSSDAVLECFSSLRLLTELFLSRVLRWVVTVFKQHSPYFLQLLSRRGLFFLALLALLHSKACRVTSMQYLHYRPSNLQAETATMEQMYLVMTGESSLFALHIYVGPPLF
jgi:hypothetical protein